MEKEEWVDVKDFDGVYVINKNGEIKRISSHHSSGNILKPSIIGGDGGKLYSYVQLYDKYKIRKSFKISDLMAQAFLGADLSRKKEFKTINKDGDVYNNNLDNIEIVYYSSIRKRMLDVKRLSKEVKPMSYWVFVGMDIVNQDDRINRQICDYFDVELSDLKSNTRRSDVVRIKRYACYIHHKIKGFTVEKTGDLVGLHHSSVTYHCKTLNDIMSYSKEDQEHLEKLKKLI